MAFVFGVLFHHQFAVFGVHGDGLTRGNVAPKQTLAEHGLHRMLDIAAQGTGTVLRVVGRVDDERALAAGGQLAA